MQTRAGVCAAVAHEPMPPTTAPPKGGDVFTAFRFASIVVLALIALAMLYAWFISLVNWPGIGV